MEKHIGECMKLVIEFEAGSDFQYDHARSLLEGVGIAVSGHLRNTHKKNWVSWEIGELEIYSVSKKLKELEKEFKRYQKSYLKDK